MKKAQEGHRHSLSFPAVSQWHQGTNSGKENFSTAFCRFVRISDTVFRDSRQGLKSLSFSELPAVGLRAIHLDSQHLSFLISKMGVIILSSWEHE